MMIFKKIILFVTMLFSVSAFSKAPIKDDLNLIPAKTLSEWMTKKNPKLFVYDVNNEKTRNQYGAITGAKLLASYDKFDAAVEFPEDKSATLVFYCANTKCMASHSSAQKAVAAGFKDVYVMKDGIMGWKENGLPTTPITQK